MAFIQEGGASWLKSVWPVFSLFSSSRLQETRGRGKIVLTAVEAGQVGSKPPAAVGVRISTGERHGFGASVLLLSRASSLSIGRAGGLAIMPKLVKLVGPSLTLLAEELFPFFARSARISVLRTLASLGLYVCPRGETWLPSFMLQACLTLVCRSPLLRKFVQPFFLSIKVACHFIEEVLVNSTEPFFK